MQDKHINDLAQYVMGLMTCQNLLFQYLIKNGIINKTEISNALDFLIDSQNKANPNQSITLSMAHVRQGIERTLPDFPPPPDDQRPKAKHPDWLKGIIQGGK